MENNDRIQVFLDLVKCNDPLDYWLYDGTGVLLRSTSASEAILDSVLRKSGHMDTLTGLTDPLPVILSSDFGVTWIAVREIRNESIDQIHLLGPFYSSGPSLVADFIVEQVGEKASQRWKDALLEVLRDLPVLSLPFYSQYALMLYYLIYGERITASDIQHEAISHFSISKKFTNNETTGTLPKDRLPIYRAERALLHAVREGDLGAARIAQNNATSTVGRVRDYAGDPLKNMQIACTTFTALCTRAAIEGGLSTTLSYSLGDAYIKSFFQAKTIAEINDTRVRMYEDFITRVHNNRCNPKYSKMVQASCDYIILHLTESLNIEVLASRLGYAKYYLSSRFKKETGCSVNDYIKFARIERAKLYLSTTNRSVEDVSLSTGFTSRVHFERVFKQVVGITPARYRAEKLTN